MAVLSEKPSLSLLKPLKKRFEISLEESILDLGEESELRDACAYALLNGGKRIRPLIVLLVAEALGHGLDVIQPSLSIEYFHTASLIADDLPCMDNDDFRREKPSLHKKFGETIALLASYALISAGYRKIYESVESLASQKTPFCAASEKVCVIALDHASRCSGYLGATGGQFLDLFPRGRSFSDIQEVIYKKSITVFEVAFLFGWIFGGGKYERIYEVKQCAFHFGMAFQILDDISDFSQDKKEKEGLNIARCIGMKKTLLLFNEEMQKLENALLNRGLFTEKFQELLAFLHYRASAV
ncbi:MAG: polyprenyl synthetase family protein [Simkania negevensis]|nr:polyprenyl synthetase family protein [Simkania negevensis]